MAQAAVAHLLLLVAVAALAAGSARAQGAAAAEENAPSTRPDIRALEIRSDVRYRYARTEVFSRVANPSNESQEVTFKAVLPDAAFVSAFAITVGGRVYPARIEGREEAQAEYSAAVSAGRTAAHVQVSARHANLFTVALNVAARDKAAFNLTYEQLLAREQGRYRLRLTLDPGQVVQRLLVEARIRDSVNLTLVRVANLRAADNEVDDAAEETDDPLATVERASPTEALVRWEPDAAAQQSMVQGDAPGLRGLLEIQYDVARSGNASELVVGDGGYFVHFFSPPEAEMPLLPKHVVFLLDTSGSMYGRKIQQLKEAMAAILSELRENDTFSLLTFASGTRLWTPADGLQMLLNDEALANGVVPATAQNVNDAVAAINNTIASGATHMYHALQAAFAAVREGRAQSIAAAAAAGGGVGVGGARQPLVFFLTDGEPNGPNSAPDEIEGAVAAAANASAAPAPLYSLAFGQGADFAFLKKLSLRGKGFARKIYEAADAALQLRNFYRRVASPLLANVSFQYADDQVNQTSLTETAFPVHLKGAELAVAGRLQVLTRGEGEPEVANAEEALRATVVGDGAGATAVARPAIVTRLEPQQATFVERLWAYLTVRQLLERAHGDDAAAQARAKELAQRYAFVTPLTSLIVVKPDNQTSGADLRDASDASRARDAAGGSGGALRRVPAAPQGSFSARSFSPARAPSGTAMMAAAGEPAQYRDLRTSILRASIASVPPRWNYLPRDHLTGRSASVLDTAGMQRMVAYSGEPRRRFDSLPRPRHRSMLAGLSGLPGPPRPQRPLAHPGRSMPAQPAPTEVVPLASLRWLSGGPAGNGSHVFIPGGDMGGLRAFIVAEPTGADAVVAASARNCTASRAGQQFPGRCLPLPTCALRAFADDVANYLAFFCALGDHAGTCCPEEVVQAQIARSAQTTS